MSLLFFLMYVNSADGLDNLVQKTEDSGQELKIKVKRDVTCGRGSICYDVMLVSIQLTSN